MKSVRVSANGRYFVDESGQPFFWLGDTQWELVRDLPVEEARALLEHRRRQGFNVFQVMLSGTEDGSKANVEGQAPWLNNDPATPNEEYFRHVDAIVAAAGELDVILVLGLYHQAQVDRFTDAKARAYARWVAGRYARYPHIIWTMYPKAKAEYIGVCRELAAGVLDADRQAGARHLITVHPDPSPTSSSFIHSEPWLDFNMSQPCVAYDLIHKMVTEDYQRTPAKPIVMAEGGYEGEEFGHVQTALEIRKQAYWSFLAGGHHSYGHVDAWKKPTQWRQWVDSPGARSLTIYRNVLSALPCWWDGQPDQTVFVGDPGTGMNLNAAARAADDRWLLVYFASSRPARLRLDEWLGGASATWIDPATGRRVPCNSVRPPGSPSLTPPGGWTDALLLVERA